MASEEKKVDVLILGAGLSGLAAAYQLSKKVPSLTFLVAEANDRVGGRTLTMHLKGPQGQKDAFDLGAHWVCRRQKDIMSLIEDLGIEYYPQNVSGTKIMQVGYGDKVRTYNTEIPNIGSILGLVDMQRVINYVETLAAQVDAKDPYASPIAQVMDSRTLEDLVRDVTDVPEVFDVFTAASLSCWGCELNQISALYALADANSAGGVMKLLLVDDGAQEFRVKGGSQQICQKLVQKIGKHRLLLQHIATKIEQKTEDSVRVTFANGLLVNAKRIVISIPPNIIAKNLSFEPQLSVAKERLYNSMVMSNMTKTYTLFKTSFWLECGFSGEVVSNGGPTFTRGCQKGPVCIFFDATTKLGTPALVGFIAGQASDQWMAKRKEEIKEAVLIQLESYFGPRVRSDLCDFYLKDWTDEAHIGGGPVNYLPPGQMHNFHELRAPHGRVHFAGTITSVEWNGYMSGAVQAGYRAVAEILQVVI